MNGTALANEPQYITAMQADAELRQLCGEMILKIAHYRYSYNFTWLGVPVIQLPPDVLAMQELVWRVRPDLIIETGVAYGGSLIFYASLLELLGNGAVLGIDVDIRAPNRAAIERHPLARRITLVEGSSTSPEVAARAREAARGKKCVLVVLDSNHTHDHVLRELELYAPLVTRGSYLVVFDTIIEDMPAHCFANRPWGPGNNPKTAVRAFLARDGRFEADRELEARLLFTVAPEGYLRCVRD